MSAWLETGTRVAFCRPVDRTSGASHEAHAAPETGGTRRDLKMTRARTRTRKSNRNRRDDDRGTALDEIRTRRYLAFVRAIVGAARSRNSSR